LFGVGVAASTFSVERVGGSSDAPAATRDRAAEAAEARVVLAAQAGIGDVEAVERKRQLAAEQAVAGTDELFGANGRDALRGNVERGRLAQRAQEATRESEPLIQESEIPCPGSPARELPEMELECGLCRLLGKDNVRGSVQCIELQCAKGCHACDCFGCWEANLGCAYVGRVREEHVDALASGFAAPDMIPRGSVLIMRDARRILVRIGERELVKGCASSSDNNFLIWTLLGAMQDHVSVMADVKWIRKELQRWFPRGHNDAVSEISFLDLRPHWRAIIALIGKSAQMLGFDRGGLIRPEAFRITCVEERWRVIGDVVGDGQNDLFILNESF